MKIFKYNFNLIFLYLIICCVYMSCEDFVEIDPPRNEMVNDNVFQDDTSILAAINGVYSLIVNSGLFTGELEVHTGTASDDFDNFSSSIANQEFASNELSPANTVLFSEFWSSSFEVINNTNLIIE